MTEEELNSRLYGLHKRLQWIADTEARAAWVSGYGANGEFDAEREHLIEQAEEVLDKLQEIGGTVPFQPK